MTIAWRGHQSQNRDVWGARDNAVPFSGHPDEVALLARMTGKPAIQVRLAIMKVGPRRDAVIAELKKSPA